MYSYLGLEVVGFARFARFTRFARFASICFLLKFNPMESPFSVYTSFKRSLSDALPDCDYSSPKRRLQVKKRALSPCPKEIQLNSQIREREVYAWEDSARNDARNENEYDREREGCVKRSRTDRGIDEDLSSDFCNMELDALPTTSQALIPYKKPATHGAFDVFPIRPFLSSRSPRVPRSVFYGTIPDEDEESGKMVLWRPKA